MPGRLPLVRDLPGTDNMAELQYIRNFSIIAHIDHGKSTLADRLMQLTSTVNERKFRDQMLDDMDLERERGITIKAHPVAMDYTAKDGHTYRLNLIDTPGHVDFTYEVERSLAACEGAVLVVDASQGVEAQTVANLHLAMQQNLTIVPILNKIDLPNADVESVATQMEDVLAIAADECLQVSAKSGAGAAEVLEAIVERIPPPTADAGIGLRGLVFDSLYDEFRGVVAYLRIVNGALKAGDKVRLMASELEYEIKEVGIFTPDAHPVPRLGEGDVGYMIPNMKEASEIQIGDTVTSAVRPAGQPLPGFKEVRPMVFAGLYPVDTADYEKLRGSLEKLSINDSSFSCLPENSLALGLGFRCGFLGLLHMEIIVERLRREYGVDIITTYPAVIYRITLRNGESFEIDNPMFFPDPTRIELIEEPMINAFVITQNEHIGDLMQLIMERRGEIEKTESLDVHRVILTCRLPLNEILVDFHDRLKSITRGYASMDYEFGGYEAADLVKLDILVHGEPVEAFSCIVHRTKAEARGRHMCKRLKDLIPPQLFKVALQASIGQKIIARETVRAMRKDVTAKCYGGDISRKRKLLEKQKEGKKRMKMVGQVSIPQEAFISVLKQQDD
jgi:GTP-binding protein LepA